MQEELIAVIGRVNELSKARACEALMLGRRRYYRWLSWKPPLPKLAWNRITPQEEAAIIEAGRDEQLVDLRSAGLMVYGHESKKFHCSVSTVQRVLARNNLQAPYVVPTRKRPLKPDIRSLMGEPKKVFSYDATDFYLISRLRVVVIPILDLGSRKFIHFGARIVSFTQDDVMDIWDEALQQEEIDTTQLTALSDRGTQMKGSRTKAHLIGKWELKLEFARPYTPDDNAWIETFIKYMKYHPECPESFETAQDVIDWVAKFQKLYNDHPHSALGYVRPNDEHAGLGNTIRTQRKENLLVARKTRLGYYHSQKTGVSNYGAAGDRSSENIVGEDFGMAEKQNRQEVKSGVLEALQGEVFETTPLGPLCQNR
jgi:transposase InsO family protein